MGARGELVGGRRVCSRSRDKRYGMECWPSKRQVGLRKPQSTRRFHDKRAHAASMAASMNETTTTCRNQIRTLSSLMYFAKAPAQQAKLARELHRCYLALEARRSLRTLFWMFSQYGNEGRR